MLCDYFHVLALFVVKFKFQVLRENLKKVASLLYFRCCCFQHDEQKTPDGMCLSNFDLSAFFRGTMIVITWLTKKSI
jgi:hypothetical protein